MGNCASKDDVSPRGSSRSSPRGSQVVAPVTTAPAVATTAVELFRPACRFPIVAVIQRDFASDLEWTASDPEVVAELNDPADFAWVDGNHELRVAAATPETVATVWPAVLPGFPVPELKPLEVAVAYSWNLRLSWADLSTSAREGGDTVPVLGGETRSRPFNVKLTHRAVQPALDPILVFYAGDRQVRISGIPLPPGPELFRRAAAVRRLHTGELKVEPTAGEMQSLPLYVDGEETFATHEMGIDRLMGATVGATDTLWTVNHAAGNYGISLSVDGIHTKTAGYAIMITKGISHPLNANFVLHDGQGNQHTFITVLKAGRVEFSAEMANCTHARSALRAA